MKHRDLPREMERPLLYRKLTTLIKLPKSVPRIKIRTKVSESIHNIISYKGFKRKQKTLALEPAEFCKL